MASMIIMAMARVYAGLTGGRILVFRIEQREGGYALVQCLTLPGFAVMLEPGEAADLDAVIDAIKAPLKAYLEVESRRLAAIAHRAAPRAELRGWAALSDDKVIAAASCA
jgi:hypothetical protein